jgi:RND family efflux transporter MFP subunit
MLKLAIISTALAFFCAISQYGCGSEQQSGPQNRSVAVRLLTVQAYDFNETVTGLGSLEAERETAVSPEIDAVLREVLFTAGQRVKEGDLLFRLDRDKLERSLESAKASLAQARARLEKDRRTWRRFRKLHEQNVVSTEEFETHRENYQTAQAEVKRLQAEVQLQEERLEDAAIRAPYDGVISDAMADPGDYVEQGETLAELHLLDPMLVRFTISGIYASRVRPGQPVQAEIDAGGAPVRANGKTVYVSPSVEESTRRLTVKASLHNRNETFKPGAFARVTLVLETRRGRPAAPEQALVSTRRGYVVFTAEDGVARSRSVVPGLRRPGLVEIAEGLSVGEQLVVEGQLRLSDGGKITQAETRNAATGGNDTERGGP